MEDYTYCPTCGAEYRPGFTRCPDCDVDLVDDPPKSAEPEADDPEYFAVLDPLHPDYVYDPRDWRSMDLVLVHTARNDFEVDIAMGLLRSEGIRAFCPDGGADGSLYTQHYRHGPGGGFRILVHQDDATQASDLLVDLDLKPQERDVDVSVEDLEELQESLADPPSWFGQRGGTRRTMLWIVLIFVLVLATSYLKETL